MGVWWVLVFGSSRLVPEGACGRRRFVVVVLLAAGWGHRVNTVRLACAPGACGGGRVVGNSGWFLSGGYRVVLEGVGGRRVFHGGPAGCWIGPLRGPGETCMRVGGVCGLAFLARLDARGENMDPDDHRGLPRLLMRGRSPLFRILPSCVVQGSVGAINL